MAKKARQSSASAPGSPQLPAYYHELRQQYGMVPARAIEWLTHVIKVDGAVPKPALPEGWRLEADGDELFVVWPGGRRNAREFSLYRGRYLIAPPGTLKPRQPPPELMEKFYPPGYEPPKRVENPDPPAVDPVLAAALDKIANALKPSPPPPELAATLQLPPELTDMLKRLPEAIAARKPPAPTEASPKRDKRPVTKIDLEKRPPQIVGEAIIADWCKEKGYRNGVPKKVASRAVWRMLIAPKRWDPMCVKLGEDPKKVLPPKSWQTVAAWLGRRRKL